MLYVTRHGETTWNAQGLVCGRADIELTDKGKLQAEMLAEKVAKLDIPVTKIIHSPLQRAKDTAQAVATKIQLPMTSDDRLMEMDFGEYDGMPSQETVFQEARTEFAVRFPNGESVLDVYARVTPLLKECLADEENVYLLVCHNALIRVINAYFHPMPNSGFFDFFVDNTELIGFDQ
ncbi:phosphoglycerate mutase [Enterococcus sp. 10A9_DIV0425]|uniref:Phosphoglycerate mutase n=1 Tax=Candidatus Enterococcus wittei TaxID=1987383 RepID=A0A242JXT5_9ENTE|nr:histidine phosphatase family protein [Enterococcus sp. 10A9_DIV0425]OTP10128.1 phosphoglycerate mutase [Enterococcus sp. 10A9_DIV0425]THE14253.1 histidine phosphatase family protein [Enterococcus hirae]